MIYKKPDLNYFRKSALGIGIGLSAIFLSQLSWAQVKPAPTPGSTTQTVFSNFNQILPYDNGVKKNSTEAIGSLCDGKTQVSTAAASAAAVKADPGCNPCDPNAQAPAVTCATCDNADQVIAAAPGMTQAMNGSIDVALTAIADTTGETQSNNGGLCAGAASVINATSNQTSAGGGFAFTVSGNIQIDLDNGTITMNGTTTPIDKMIDTEVLKQHQALPNYSQNYSYAKAVLDTQITEKLKEYYKTKGYSAEKIAKLLDAGTVSKMSEIGLKLAQEGKKFEKPKKEVPVEAVAGNQDTNAADDLVKNENEKNKKKIERKIAGVGLGVACGDSVCGVPLNDIWKMINKQTMIQCQAQNVIAAPSDCIIKNEEF